MHTSCQMIASMVAKNNMTNFFRISDIAIFFKDFYAKETAKNYVKRGKYLPDGTKFIAAPLHTRLLHWLI